MKMEKEGTSPLRLEAIPDELVMSRIREIRGQKVVLDADLAQFYGTETSLLKRQVRRNIDRFPEDFMFELTEKEVENLRCQIGISSWGGNRYLPMVFTEQGVAMLSSVLSSQRAIAVNVQIIRVFTRMRKMWLAHHEILLRLEELELRLNKHGEHFEIVFYALARTPQPS